MKFSDSDHSMSIVFDFFINETQKQSFRFTQTPSFKIMPTTSPPTSDDDDDEPLNPVLLQDGVSATASRSRGNESPQAIQTNRLSKQESKELQSVVAVFVYDSNTESMRTVQQQNYIEQVFHGDTTKDIGSQLLLLVEGVHPRYAKMYYSIQNNSDPSKSPSVKKTICPLYSPNNNTKELVTGIDINVEFLQRATLNNKKIIDGRALQNLAKDASIKNGKKAVSLAKQFLQNNETLPSGKSIEDLLEFVNDSMWKKENTKNKDRDPKWVFHGYVSFVLFGCPCLVNNDDRLGVYCEGGEKEGKSASRVVAKKKSSDAKSMKRAAESTIILGERGLTIDQKLAHRHITNEEMDQLEREVNNCTNHACISMQLLDSAISDLLQRQSQSIELFKLYASMGCNDDKSQMAETIKKSATNWKDYMRKRNVIGRLSPLSLVVWSHSLKLFREKNSIGSHSQARS